MKYLQYIVPGVVVGMLLLGMHLLAGSIEADKKAHPRPVVPQAELIGDAWSSIHRFHDKQAKVTCWITRDGISCLPDNTYEGDVP